MSEISRAERVSRSESLRVFLNRRSFFDPDSINLLRERENWKFLKKATVEKRFGKGGDEKSNRIARYVFRLNDSTLPYACLFAKEIRRYSPRGCRITPVFLLHSHSMLNSISSIRDVQLHGRRRGGNSYFKRKFRGNTWLRIS